MGDSWIVSNLNAALTTWNDKLGEIWQLLTQSPQTFKDGQVWAVMVGIHGALQAIGYGLLVLFFAAGVVKTCGTFVEAKRPEQALKLFIRFALAKAAVTYGLDLMLAIFQIVQGMVSTVINQSGVSGMSAVTLPQELIDAINEVGFWDSIPLWAVTLIGGLLIMLPRRRWRNRASGRGKHCWRMARPLLWGRPGMPSADILTMNASRTGARRRREYEKGTPCPRTRRIQTRKRLQGRNRNAVQHRSKAGIFRNGSGRPRTPPGGCAASTRIKSNSEPQPTRCGKRSRLDKRQSAHR